MFFANTSGDIGIADEGAGFFDWLREGGAFVGIHSATSTLQDNRDYIELIGASARDDGPEYASSLYGYGPGRQVTVHVEDPTHPACTGLPASFRVFDEIREYSESLRANVHVLLSLNRHPQNGHPGDFPVAWTKRFGQGRMFYTSFGHSEEVYSNEYILSHLVGGMRWALGAAAGDDSVGNSVSSDAQLVRV